MNILLELELLEEDELLDDELLQDELLELELQLLVLVEAFNAFIVSLVAISLTSVFI